MFLHENFNKILDEDIFAQELLIKSYISFIKQKIQKQTGLENDGKFKSMGKSQAYNLSTTAFVIIRNRFYTDNN